MIDDWWRSRFRHLLDRELAGVDPRSLVNRWLVLDQLAFGSRKRRVSFRVPEEIAHFLDDADIRGKDRNYAERQWASAREWIDG